MSFPCFLVWQKIAQLKKNVSDKSQIFKFDSLSFLVVDRFTCVSIERKLSYIDEEISSGRLLKHDAGTIASIKNYNGKLFFLKRVNHHSKKFYHLLKYFYQPSRGYLNWVGAEILLENKILTPTIFAIGERRHFGIIKHSYLIAEAMDNVCQLDEFLRTNKFTRESFKDLLVRLGKLVATVHRAGLYHGDLKCSNLFLKDNQIGMWDLDGIKIFQSSVPSKWAIRDLGRIYSCFLMDVDQNPNLSDWILSVKEGADIICSAYGIDSDQIMIDLRQYWFRKDKLSNFVL